MVTTRLLVFRSFLRAEILKDVKPPSPVIPMPEKVVYPAGRPDSTEDEIPFNHDA